MGLYIRLLYKLSAGFTYITAISTVLLLSFVRWIPNDADKGLKNILLTKFYDL